MKFKMPENYDTLSLDKMSDNDLEDGEIPEELEDISDCSLSEILSIEDLNNDCDTELLREEAMKSLHQEKDEVTEEELYRLEALKSLLINLESTEKSEEKSVSKLHTKKRRKRKKKAKEKLHDDKRRKVLIMKAKEAEDSSKPVIKIELTGDDESNSQSRSWYPRIESALLSEFHEDDTEQINAKCKPKVCSKLATKSQSNAENFIPIAEAQPVKPVEANPVRLEPLKTPVSQFQSQFKKVTKHSIRKIDLPILVSNKFALSKTGKFKLVNVPRYALKKTNVKNDTSSDKANVFRSKYSINRKQTQLPRINPKDFVIKLNNDDDSGDENESNVSASSGVTVESCCEETASKLSDNRESSPPFVIDTNPDPSEFTGPRECDKALEGSTLPNVREANLETKISSAAQKKLPNDSMPDWGIKTVSETNNGKIVKSKSNLLKDAEMNLIQIRTRLLSDIVELEGAVKRNTVEKTKLKNMTKKLIALKSMVLKFEKKVDLQRSKLMLSSKSMYLLLKGVELRTGTCSQMKEICIRAGKGVVGPGYRPPVEYEKQIVTKRKAIDFSKFTLLNIDTQKNWS